MGVVYLFLSVLGAVVPYAKLVPWVREHGLNLPLLLTELFSTRIGGFFGLDVILSAVTLLIFIRRDGGASEDEVVVAAGRGNVFGWSELWAAAVSVPAGAAGGMTRQD